MKAIFFLAVSCALVQSALQGPVGKDNNCEHLDADIVLVLDSSSSIYPPDFRKQLDFVSIFAKLVGFGTSGTQISLVLFGDYVKPVFSLNEYTTLDEVRDKVKTLQHLAGRSTFTHLALKWVRENSFLPTNGGRAGVPHITMLLTDGKSTKGKLTEDEAKQLKDDGVKVFAVGIGGRVSPSELRKIASTPKEEFVLLFPDFSTLSDVTQLSDLAYKTCEVETTTETPPTTPAIPDEIRQICANKPADVVFVLDKSSSIGKEDFSKLLDFVKSTVRVFDVSQETTQIGVLTYSDEYELNIEFFLDSYSDVAEMEQQIDNIYFSGGGTDTAMALRVTTEDMFAYDFGARRGVPHIAIVITDGKSEDETATKTAARKARESGMIILAIGVGGDVDPIELGNIASDAKYVHTVDNYDALGSLRNLLAKETCEIEPPQADKRLCGAGHDSDIIFSVDTSGIGGKELQTELEFIKSVTETFDVESGSVRCGMITHCPTVSEIALNEAQTRKDFKEKVSSHSKSSLYKVMNKTHEEGFTKANGARSYANKYMVLFINGDIDDPMEALKEAFRMKKEDIKIFVVAIGAVDKKVVDRLASQPPGDYVIQVASHQELDGIRSKLEERLCAYL